MTLETLSSGVASIISPIVPGMVVRTRFGRSENGSLAEEEAEFDSEDTLDSVEAVVRWRVLECGER